ncbi:tetratricopeptide repeat protein [Candidatus Enterovibrio altilux]|uniref:tetratricopeptide repeat protein n=1 Tax=Candidatus Enterovibrio altilux TaxID=1927128 RepID=UPI001CC242B0|nr:tetratricopeptide repeat protein [Candidatus Enterovibrio luxaltus]
MSVLDAENGSWQEAIRKLNKALLVEPNNSSLLFDKANILAQQGMNKDALKIVNNLLIFTPHHTELLLLQQQLTAVIGKLRDSRCAAKKIAKIQNQKFQAINAEIIQTLKLIEQMVSSGNQEQAKSLYHALLSVAGDIPQALIGLAKLQLAEKNYGSALQFLLRGYNEVNPVKDIVILLIHCYIKLEQYQAARKHCIDGLKCWPDEIILSRLLIQNYEKEQNWLEAYRIALGAIKQQPNDIDLHYRLATNSFNLLKTRYNFTRTAIIECQKHIELAAAIANDENKDILSIYLAEVLWYKGDSVNAKKLLEDYLSRFPDDIEVGFNISFVYRTLGEWAQFYRTNELGITCGRRLRYNGTLPQWDLTSPRDDIVLVMPEQGIGDEIFYFHNLKLILNNCQKAYVACDPRLSNILKNAYPEAIIIPIKRIDNTDIIIPAHVLPNITSWISGGSLAALCFKNYGRHIYQSKYLKIPQDLKQQWKTHLDALRAKNQNVKLIGLCWRSGLTAATRNMHYLVAEEVAYLLKQFQNTVFINLQYGDCTKELKKINKLSDINVVQLEGLNLHDDFDNTAAVINALDAVITAGTAVHRLTSAIGTPCHVFFAGMADSIFDEPQASYCPNEYGYFYPPMMENKYPLLQSIAKHVQTNLRLDIQ